jgi:hypothetical protein
MPRSGDSLITDAIIRIVSAHPQMEPDEVKNDLARQGIVATIKTVSRFRNLTLQFMRLGWTPP